MLTRHAFRVAIVFVAAGLLSRYMFQRFETRWQIVIFWGLVATYQLVLRPAFQRRVSLASTALDFVAVTVAIVVMKVAIEGKL